MAKRRRRRHGCKWGKLKSPRGRKVCRKRPRRGGVRRRRGGSTRRRHRHCRFGVVKRGRRRGQCLKHRRPRCRWHSAGRSGARYYASRSR